MVVVSVGTDHHPFDRLMAWVDQWLGTACPPGVECVVQSGTSRPPTLADARPVVPYKDLMDLMRTATAVVIHGGPASIMDARAAGHVPIVVPRRKQLGEHVDDHQLAFCRRVAETGTIKLALSWPVFAGSLSESLATPARSGVAPAPAVGVSGFGSLVDRLLEGR